VGLLARWRRQRLPAEARRQLVAGEHVVGWAPVDGGYLVATNHGLYLPDRDGRLGWHEIHKASWSGRELTVLPSRVLAPAGSAAEAPVDVVADAEPATFLVLDPGELPHQVRERVTRSVAYSSHHPLPNGGVRVLARRVPGVDGLSWVIRYDEGTEAAPEDHRVVAELLATGHAETAG
jgi:hypothetical protein